MRIACLQFAPQLGDVDNNLNRADAVLSKANPQDLDLLVLPELAFSGYNFKSLQEISPFLEPTAAGITSLWARTTALKYECVVTVGYPEKVDLAPKWPASPEYYNSAITVNADGETIANYRKSFLYYTDETWALEGPDGFYDGEIDGLGNVAMGICMDLNPYKFEAPWSAWEFAYHILHKQANLVILSMAWLTRENARSYSRAPKEPDMDTLSYWLARLEPIIRAETEGEIVVVIANRCGIEGEAVYAGTSAVLGIQGGEVKVYGILGRGEKELLVIDTNLRPQAKLISEPVPNSTVESTDFYNRAGSRTSADSAFSGSATQKTCSDLSVNTKSSAFAPQSPVAMDFTMSEVVSHISPVDPKTPNFYFGVGPNGSTSDAEPKIANLQSTAANPQVADVVSVDSPTLSQNDSLKLSEVRKSNVTPISDTKPLDDHVLVRPPSPKSRNCSRTRHRQHQEPALVSLDLAQEPQITSLGKSTQYEASAVLHHSQANFEEDGIGPRMERTLSRPKSVLW